MRGYIPRPAKNNYQLALDAGFAGTLEEWLESIRGEEGATPTIGGNGNWWVDGVDTGLPSRGAQGLPGGNGAAGSPGKSAYEIAKENDSGIGTEAEWLESLKGKDGQIAYTTFAIDSDTGNLMAISPDGYDGPSFALVNGKLEVTV